MKVSCWYPTRPSKIDRGFALGRRNRVGVRMSDLITVCIPTYRRPTMLLHCLHSCIGQDYRPLEIDVSDNSSSNDTQILVESVPRPPGVSVRYWRNEPPTDSVENQKKLFAAARGYRLVMMNDDDVLPLGRPPQARISAGRKLLRPDIERRAPGKEGCTSLARAT